MGTEEKKHLAGTTASEKEKEIIKKQQKGSQMMPD
jgi:hypothetical protein